MEPKNAQTHIYRHEWVSPGEAALLEAYARPGMRVLDIGCAASGRSARLLRQFGCEVTAFDLNEQAVREFNDRPDSGEIDLATADMCALPFKDKSFELVLCALHGLDYLLTDQLRLSALHEIGRVLVTEGVFIFNSLNPVGLMLSPGGFSSQKIIRLRLRKLLTLDFMKPTTIDMNGIEL